MTPKAALIHRRRRTRNALCLLRLRLLPRQAAPKGRCLAAPETPWQTLKPPFANFQARARDVKLQVASQVSHKAQESWRPQPQGVRRLGLSASLSWLPCLNHPAGCDERLPPVPQRVRHSVSEIHCVREITSPITCCVRLCKGSGMIAPSCVCGREGDWLITPPLLRGAILSLSLCLSHSLLSLPSSHVPSHT